MFFQRGNRLPRFLSSLLSYLALGVLLVCAWGVDRNTLFPGKVPQPVDALCDYRYASEAEIAAYRNVSKETFRLLKTQRGLTAPEICRLPEDKLARAISRAQHPKPDHPDDALAFRRMQLEDENGLVPADGLEKAVEQVRRMQSLQGPRLPSGAGVNAQSWEWLGPGNVGGRVRALLVHPYQPATLWVGSVSGGIWKSTDGGAAWQPLDDFMANLAVSSLVMHPVNPDILYAGTGEGFYNSDGIQGAGVFKTTDGGSTWDQLPATANSNWFYVNRLAIDPNNGDILLAATRTGLYRSVDAGASWTHLLAADALDVDFHPSDSGRAVASGYAGLAWYTINGGLSWAPASPFPATTDRVEVAYAPRDPQIVYAGVDLNGGELWKSVDGGKTFLRVNSGTYYLGAQGWYNNTLWVDPTNSSTLVVGGIDLYRSTNGGLTFSKISEWWNAPLSAHADHHIIQAHPHFDGTSNRSVYFGNDGGVYKTDNIYSVMGISGWQELNNNLGITQFYGAAGSPATGVIIGGTQDNGTLRYTGGTESWESMYGGDGGFCAADPTDPNYFYGEYVYLQLLRSENGGASADYICGKYWDGQAWNWKADPFTIPDAKNGQASFIAPFLLDPNNPNRILAGGVSLWRTENARAQNTAASGPAWYSVKAPVPFSSPITAIAIARGNPDLVWVGHRNGNVYKTTNGTHTTPAWIQVDDNPPGVPNRFLTRISIDPRDHNRVYLTFGGYKADNVWRTGDGGLSWTNISGSGTGALPGAPVRSLVIHPDFPDWLYVGSEVGVFTSDDGGAGWFLPQDGPANVSVDELFWMDRTLVAATHGRGLYRVKVMANFTASPASGLAPLKVDFTNTTISGYTSSAWDFGDGATSTLDHPSHTYTTPGTYSVTLTAGGPGWTDTERKIDYIRVYQPVTAGFRAAPIGGPAPLGVVFTNDSSGDYTHSLWDFGDGLTSTQNGPLIHTFTAAGVYTVSLAVSGPGGTDLLVQKALVTVYTPVQAGISASPRTGVAPLEVVFTNTSSGDFTGCLWEFGDGAASALCDPPAHRYMLPGSYTVSLTLTGPGGTSVETRSGYIVIWGGKLFLPVIQGR